MGFLCGRKETQDEIIVSFKPLFGLYFLLVISLAMIGFLTNNRHLLGIIPFILLVPVVIFNWRINQDISVARKMGIVKEEKGKIFSFSNPRIFIIAKDQGKQLSGEIVFYKDMSIVFFIMGIIFILLLFILTGLKFVIALITGSILLLLSVLSFKGVIKRKKLLKNI